MPQTVLGRCLGLFRAVSLFAAILFNYWFFGDAQANYMWIFLGVGVVYTVGFSLMCLNVKEGRYPPPPDASGADRPNVIRAVVTYFRDGFGHAYYLWYFAATLLTGLAAQPFNLYSVFYAESLSMSLNTYGKCAALTFGISLVLAYPLGWLADRFHPLRMTMLALALYVAVMAGGFLFARNGTTFAIALVVHGVVSGIQFTVVASLGQRLLPRSKFTEISSAGGVIGSLVGIVFAPSLGMFLDFTHQQSTPVFDFATGFYDYGYGPQDLPIASQRRDVLFLKPDIFIVADHMTPHDPGTHHYQARWQLDTAHTQLDPATGILATADPGLPNLVVAPLLKDGLDVAAVSGQENPEILGWDIRSSRNPPRLPATTVLQTRDGAGPRLFLTLFLPLRANQPNPISKVEAGVDLQSATVTLNDGRKIIIACPPAGGISAHETLANGNPGRVADPSGPAGDMTPK